MALAPTLLSATAKGNFGLVRELLLESGKSFVNCSLNSLTPLHCACMNGHLEIVRVLVSEFRADLTVRTKYGDTPLHCACWKGHLDVVRVLVSEFKADLTVRTRYGDTPLHCACEKGHFDVVRVLMSEFKADSTVKNDYGYTVLHSACENGHLDVVRVLVSEFKADLTVRTRYGDTPLHCACEKGHLDVVRVLMSEFKADSTVKNDYGYTVLHSACENGHLDVVRVLVSEFKADLKVTNYESRTPLLCACKNGHLDVVRALMSEFKADLSVSTHVYGSKTPLHCACEYGHLDVVRMLFSEFKANLTANSSNDDTLLHCACKNGHLDVVRVLVSEFKADLTVKNSAGDTPLHYACNMGHLGVIRVLVSEFKADLTVQNTCGYTPLHYACKNGHLAIVRVLVSDFKADLTAKSDYGYTPLHYACESGHVDVVRTLILEFNADHSVRSKNGITPLYCACKNNRVHVVKMLISEFQADLTAKTWDNGKTPLHIACELKYLDAATLLTSESKAGFSVKDSEGQTPLHFACQVGNVDVVKILLPKFRADILEKDRDGFTPLHCAVKCWHFTIVKLLVSEYEGDVNTLNTDDFTRSHLASDLEEPVSDVSKLIPYGASLIDNYGRTPLHYACEKGNVEVVRTLMTKFKGDLSLQDHKGRTILMLAVIWGHSDVVHALLDDYHCPVTGQDQHGMGVLHHACARGDVGVVQALCEHGADVNLHDEDNNLPLHNAARYGQLEIVVSLIEEFNCNPSEPGQLGRTCLHMASRRGYSSLVEWLLKSATPLVLDNFSNTPLHLASQYSHLECVKLLIGANAPLLLRNSRGNTSIDVASSLCKGFLIEALEANHDQMQLDYSSILRHAKKKYSGSHSITRVFVIGNPGAGKSSFIKALQRESFFQSFRKVSESSVPLHTAGIIPIVHMSKQYGRVLFYDFAGDAEYYSSHAAIFECLASSRKGDNIFIVVVDLREDSATIEATLHYWLSFVQYQKFSKPLFAVVGSHLDLASEQVSKGQLLDEFCSSHNFQIKWFMLDCRDPRSNQIAQFKRQILTWITESQKWKISSSASLLLGLLEKEFSADTACPIQNILTCVSNTGVCLSVKLVHQAILELHEVGILLLLGDCAKDKAHVALDVLKLTNEVHMKLFSKSALRKHTDSKTPLNIGIIPEKILAKILPPHITKECLVHLQYCQEICHSDIGFFPALAQEAESTEQSSFLFFPALCSVDKSQVLWDEASGTSFSIGWLALCHNAHDYFPPRFLHVLLLRLVYGFTLAPEEQDAHDYNRRCSMWKKGVHWLMEEGAEFMVELVQGSKGVIVFCKGYGQEETSAGIFTQVVSCVLQTKAEFCHSIQPQYFFVDSSAEADYLSEDHQFPVGGVERGLATGNEFAISVGNGRGRLELSKLKCMRKLTQWNSLFLIDSKTVLAYLRDIVPELYQLGECLGVPREDLLALQSDYKNDVKRQKRELVELWMSLSEDPPCWWYLAEALKDIEHGILAEKITKDHKSSIQLQKKILGSQTQALKPDEEFLHSFSGVVESKWPSLAVSLALSEEEIGGLRGMVELSQQEVALQMLKIWASREEATYGHLSHVLKTVSLFHYSN